MLSGRIEEVTLRQVLEEIQNSKAEVKNCISASEARLLLEISALKSRNEVLERENMELKNRIEKTERWCNKNNIIIFGLNKDSELTIEYLCSELNRLLNVQIQLADISDYYTLGKKETSPIKVEFVSYQTRKLIFKQVKNLKGTGVSITGDLTLQQRQENRKLKSFLLKARADPTVKSYIKGNKLVVGKEIYTVEDLESTEEGNKPNSAPNTPTSSQSRVSMIDAIGSVVVEAVPGPSNKRLLTPHLATQKKVFLKKKKSPPGGDKAGMKLRPKDKDN